MIHHVVNFVTLGFKISLFVSAFIYHCPRRSRVLKNVSRVKHIILISKWVTLTPAVLLIGSCCQYGPREKIFKAAQYSLCDPGPRGWYKMFLTIRVRFALSMQTHKLFNGSK